LSTLTLSDPQVFTKALEKFCADSIEMSKVFLLDLAKLVETDFGLKLDVAFPSAPTPLRGLVHHDGLNTVILVCFIGPGVDTP
jgi:hypothetical protein